MKITKHARREAKQLFRACFRDGKLDDQRVRQVVSTLMDQKPRGYLAILGHLQRLVKLEEEQRTARVESATPLDPGLQANVKQALERAYGPDVKVSFAEKPELLGGLRIQVGSDVYDGSIQAKLQLLQETF